MRELEISRPLFSRLVDDGVERLSRNSRSQLVTYHEPITVTKLARGGFRLLAMDPQTMSTPQLQIGRLDFHLCRSGAVFSSRTQAILSGAYGVEGWHAWMLVGTGRISGRIAAFLKNPAREGVERADTVHLVGPGMERIEIGSSSPRRAWPASENIWSRSQGAIGRAAWERLVTTRFLLIGAGRSGTLLAQAMANLGVRHLTLLDADEVEAHNLDGSPLFSIDSIGHPKVDVLAGQLESLAPWCTVTAQQSTAASEAGIAQIKIADVVFSAVDSMRSLFQVHALCRIYGRTLVTVGTRISRDELGMDVAADVGLFYGGHPGCVLCVGGPFPGFHASRRALTELPESMAVHRRSRRQGAFTEERRGSLLSVNSMAVGCALYTFQSAFGGGAAWANDSQLVRLTYDEHGVLQTRTLRRQYAHTTGQCLCTMMNTGDEGIGLLRKYAMRSRMDFSHPFR